MEKNGDWRVRVKVSGHGDVVGEIYLSLWRMLGRRRGGMDRAIYRWNSRTNERRELAGSNSMRSEND